jgi:hypothetical protein
MKFATGGTAVAHVRLLVFLRFKLNVIGPSLYALAGGWTAISKAIHWSPQSSHEPQNAGSSNMENPIPHCGIDVNQMPAQLGEMVRNELD